MEAPGPVSMALAGDDHRWGWAMTRRSGREVGDRGGWAPLTLWPFVSLKPQLPVLPGPAPPCRDPQREGHKLSTDSRDCTEAGS